MEYIIDFVSNHPVWSYLIMGTVYEMYRFIRFDIVMCGILEWATWQIWVVVIIEFIVGVVTFPIQVAREIYIRIKGRNRRMGAV